MNIQSLKDFIKKALFFTRLTDEDGLLSITHIACIIVLTKVAMEPNPNIVDMGSLLITLSLYYGKKHLMKNKAAISDENKIAITKIEQRMAQLADKQSGIATAMGFKPTQQK